MYGILGTVIHNGMDELHSTLIRGLRAVEYRVSDSAGVAINMLDGLVVEKRAGKSLC